MPGTPPTTPRFGAKRLASTDTFDIANDHNAAVDALDLAAKFTSSLSTARPTSPVVDQYNYSTDTNVLERWTGSAWVRPEPKPHASTHQDGGTDALTVREAMMDVGATGLGKGSVSAYRNAALSLATGAVIIFDTDSVAGAAWDTSNWYDTATGRFTPQVAADFRISAFATPSVALAAGKTWGIELFKNGAIHKRLGVEAQVSGGPPAHAWGTANVRFNGTTDFIDIRTNHDVGVATALAVGAPYCYFHAELIGRS